VILTAGIGLVLVLGVLSAIGAEQRRQNAKAGSTRTPAAVTPASSLPSNQRLLMTYYFYWYDAQTGAHLNPPAVLNNHFPPTPPLPSWRSPEWHRKQLQDMSAAGIDVVLPVYWGFDRPQDQWSTLGLPILAQAWRQAKVQGLNPPLIGMFLDTSIVNKRDLTTPDGNAWFYANFKDFFSRIPRDEWANVGGRPIASLFTSDFTNRVDQGTFDYVYSHFQADFGVRPYIIREVSWDYPILGWTGNQRIRDYQHPIQTENSYQWAAAIHGYINSGGVAEVGPGFNERGIPGRSGDFRDRAGGSFYRTNLQAAINSGKRIIAIETWDEMHEASGICESLEYGRQYIDITRTLADVFHAKP